MYDTDQRKLLSALCHGAIFFSSTLISIGLPIAILFISNDPVVKDNAIEAINFHFNVWLYGLILGVLISITLGLLVPLAGLWFLLHWGLTIWALFSVLGNPDKPFRYPYIFRIF
ncbi:MAG: DUF4870 domain-containing protein [Nostocaceae cyanobacterium]|nr:DUF4870 domain-containing protein [Nostocaceae cyanobacterium]